MQLCCVYVIPQDLTLIKVSSNQIHVFKFAPLNQKDVVTGFAILTVLFNLLILRDRNRCEQLLWQSFGIMVLGTRDTALLYLPYCIHNVTLTLTLIQSVTVLLIGNCNLSSQLEASYRCQ